jgi:hypothetical protein
MAFVLKAFSLATETFVFQTNHNLNLIYILIMTDQQVPTKIFINFVVLHHL